MDIKYMPQMTEETALGCLFAAIDCAIRWAYLCIYNNQGEVTSTDSPRRLRAASPIKIVKLPMDNGSQFINRFTDKDKKPSGKHALNRGCILLGIEHRSIPPCHPQTNGMVGRFNVRINDIPAMTLARYTTLYNQHIQQKALVRRTLPEAMRQ